MVLKSSLIKCPNCGSSEVKKAQGPDYECVHCSASFRVFVNFEGVGPASGIDDIWRCHQCGLRNQTDSVYCGGCGVSLVETCPSCREVKRNILLYCPHCGVNVDSEIKRLYEAILQTAAEIEFLLKGTDVDKEFPYTYSGSVSRRPGNLFPHLERFAAYPAYSGIILIQQQIGRCSSAFSRIQKVEEECCRLNVKPPPEPDDNPLMWCMCVGCGGTMLGAIILIILNLCFSSVDWKWFFLGPILMFAFIMCALNLIEKKRLNAVVEYRKKHMTEAEQNYSTELKELRKIPIPTDVLQKMKGMS